MKHWTPAFGKQRPGTLVFVGGLLIGSGPVSAQVVDLEASLRCFEAVHLDRDHITGQPYRCPSRAMTMEPLVQSPDHVGDETVQAGLNLLVDLAHRTTQDKVKAGVCSALSSAANRKDDAGGPRVPGVVERLEGLYFSGDATLRHWCLGVAHTKADRPRMIEFLKRIATEPDPPDAGSMWPASLQAIEGLESLGEEGRAVIAELVAAGSISTYPARIRAEHLLGRPPGGPER